MMFGNSEEQLSQKNCWLTVVRHSAAKQSTDSCQTTKGSPTNKWLEIASDFK